MQHRTMSIISVGPHNRCYKSISQGMNIIIVVSSSFSSVMSAFLWATKKPRTSLVEAFMATTASSNRCRMPLWSMIALHTDHVAVREIFSQRPRQPPPRQGYGPSAEGPFSGGCAARCCRILMQFRASIIAAGTVPRDNGFLGVF